MEVNNLETNRRAQIGNITIPLLKGEQGYSISRIVRTSGDGGAGSIDTYTVYIDTTPETAIGTFQVVNGTGGDMSKSVYDIDNDDIVDRATGDGNGNEITATYETIANVTALASRVATLEQAGYITKSVADLANYYLKSETYTKQEVNNLCDMIPKFSIEVVSVLPTQDISETTIYLLRDDEETLDVYQEYIYVNNTWERIGGQRIDLSNYYQKSETYSKDELNGKLVNVGTEAPIDGRRVWFKKGKNLFEPYKTNTTISKNGIDATRNNDGTITLNGTATANTFVEILYAFRSGTATQTNIVIPLKNTKTYTLSINKISGTTTSNDIRIATQTNISDTQIYASINNPNQITNSIGLYRGYLRIPSGTTLTNLIVGIQLEEGTSATTYEPYIEKSIKVNNEDFISMSDLVSVGSNQPSDGKRVWFAKSKNLININNINVKKFINRNGGLATSDDWSATNYIKIQPNTTYTLSGIINSGTTAKICFYSDTNVSSFLSAINSTEYTFTTPNNANYVRLSLNSETPTSAMLEQGSTATSYEPYIDGGIYVDNELYGDNYSNSEQVIGKWIDGKPLYRKVITFGALANNGNKTIPYGSSNNLIKFDIYAKNPTGNYLFKVPLGGTNYINSYVEINSHQIVVQTNSDRTNVTDNYVIIEYTKTTD